MRGIVVEEFGGPQVLTYRGDLPAPAPRDGLVAITVDSAGVNFADTHQAEDTYLAPQQLPLVPGSEVVGRTDDGRRVVALLAGGGYAERALAQPDVVFDLPDEVDDTTALGLVLQGTTAWHLLRTVANLRRRESVVVHAGAGGVGTIAVQLAREWRAGRVVASASTPDKRALALSLGADVAVDVSTCTTADEVRDVLLEAGGGKPVDVVLEMTGGVVTDGSLAALGPFGRLCLYGLASRTPPPPIDPTRLMAGSKTVSGFWLVDVLRREDGLQTAMEELLSLAASGALRVVDGGHYPLERAREAHEAIRSRATVGKLVLDVRDRA